MGKVFHRIKNVFITPVYKNINEVGVLAMDT